MRSFLLILLIPLALWSQAPVQGIVGNRPAGRGGAAMPAVPPPPPTPAADLATVEGQVVNGLGGTPLRKATVTLNRQGGGPLPAGARGAYSAPTDAAGRFSITGVEPGTYRVTASHTGFLDMSYNARRPGGNGTPVDIGRGQRMTNVIFKLTPHGVVSGKVTDEDGDPLEGVLVQIMQLVYNQGRKQLQQTNQESTNDLGEYRLSGILPGKYYLSVMYRGGRRLLFQTLDDQPQEDYSTTFFPGVTDISAAAPIQVGPGDQLQGLNIRLNKIHTVRVRGRAVNNSGSASAEGGRGRGSITIETGVGQVGQVGNLMVTANPGVQVRMVPRSSLNPTNVTMNAPVRPDGSFEFLSVAPGAYTLIGVSNAGGRGRAVRQPLDVGNSNIEGLNVVINPGATLSGHVRFDGAPPDPMPVLNVRLTLRDPMQGVPVPAPAKVDADGSFRFDDLNPDHYNVAINVPVGFYLKSVRAGSTDAMVAGVNLSNGAGALDIVIGANPPQVNGSVLNASTQQPAPAVMVVLIPQEKERQELGFFYSVSNTDQYGNFTFSRVTPGEYKAYAWEDVQNGQWFDPDFMKQYDGKGEVVSAKEGSPVNVKLTMIPAK